MSLAILRSITAGTLRSAGIHVPANVPDCATIDASAIHLKVAQPTFSDGVFTLPVEVAFSQPFAWANVSITVKNQHGE